MFYEENFGKSVGILGGGQLAQMLARTAKRLGFNVEIFSNEIDCCSKNDGNLTIADFYHTKEIENFAKKCDFITIETENIPVSTLKFLENLCLNKIKTSSQFVEISQNRLNEKSFAKNLDIKTAPFQKILSQNDIHTFFDENGPCIIKTTTQGYDGKGQTKIINKEDIPNLDDKEYIIEKMINFDYEISVIATKKNEELVLFPIPRNTHRDGILRESLINNQIPKNIIQSAIDCTKKISQNISHTGTFAIEFFVAGSNVIFNEMAPRVHNSGHFSQNLCNICQFENHIRAVCSLPVIQPMLLFNGKMINIIGDDIYNIDYFLDKKNYFIHLYGKKYVENRKLGHINFIETI